MYEKCGDSEFSTELRQGTVRVMKSMEALSVCVSENVDLEKIMQERMEFVRRKLSTLNCTADALAKLQQRRPAFEAMIQQSYEINLAAIFEKIGVVIDENGNVLDR
jgi:hypothetical protein